MTQLVGSVTIGLLALYGLLMVVGSDAAWAAAGLQTPAWAVRATDPTVPLLMNYQGTLKDNQGNPLSGSYTLTFRLYDDVAALPEDALWEETHAGVTLREGYFNVVLGDGQPVSNPLPPTLFTDPDRFMGVRVDPYEEMLPRQRFASVPYAVHADYAFRLAAPDGDPLDALRVDNDGNVIASGVVTGGYIASTGDVGAWGNVLGKKFLAYDDLEVVGDANVTGDVSAQNMTASGVVTGGYIASTGDVGAWGNILGKKFFAYDGLEVVGDASVSNNISWGGHLTDMTVTSYHLEGWNGYPDPAVTMVPIANSVCFLDYVWVADLAVDNRSAGCKIDSVGGNWVLSAELGGGGEPDVKCTAYCLQW